MSLIYKESAEFQKELDKIEEEMWGELRHAMFQLFGSVAVRSLASWDEENLRLLVRETARRGAREMEFTYIDQESKRSQEATGNMMRAVFAGIGLGEKKTDPVPTGE